MARVERTLTVPCAAEDAFDFVAAFENVAHWDPGTVSSEKLSAGPARVGSAYQLVLKLGTATTSMRYQIVVYDRPLRLAIHGEGERLSVEDDVLFSPVDDGTRITYRGVIRLKGFRRFFDFLARGAVNRVTDDMLAGLARALSKPATKGVLVPVQMERARTDARR